jgi:hypothetical protein
VPVSIKTTTLKHFTTAIAASTRDQSTTQARGLIPGAWPLYSASAPSRARCRVHRSAPQSPRRSGRSLRGHARTDWGAHRGHERGRGDRRRHDAHDKGFSGLPPADDNPRRRPANCARLRRHNRRSVAHPPIASGGAYLGLVPRRYQSGEVDYVGGISNAATGGCGPCCTRSPTRT